MLDKGCEKLENWKNEIMNFMIQKLKNPEKILKGIETKFNNIPNSLYRYYSCNENSFECLKKDLGVLKTPLEFNDPFDTKFTVSNKFYESVFKNGIKNDIYPIEINEYVKQFLLKSDNVFNDFKNIFEMELPGINKYREDLELENDNIRKIYGILCFSEIKDSILMWSHYTRNHEGFCVEYNFKELGIKDKRTKCLFPLFYGKNLYDMSEELFSPFSKKKINPWIGIYCSLTKYEGWAYEREWRYIHHKRGKKINLPTPKAVYLGIRMNEDNKNEILKIANEKNFNVFQTRPDMSKYSLYFEKIVV